MIDRLIDSIEMIGLLHTIPTYMKMFIFIFVRLITGTNPVVDQRGPPPRAQNGLEDQI